MKKTALCILLTCLLLCPLICSCGDTGNQTAVTTEAPAASTSGSSDSTAAATETDYYPSNVPSDLKFSGQTIKILYWKDVERIEFEVEDDNGETVNDALFKRNNTVEADLGITFEWTGTPGNFGNQAAFVTTCTNANNAGGDLAYDIFAGYSLTAATIAMQGLSKNMSQYEILDFTLPWWPDSLISQAQINGKTYFASGDISTNVLHMMYCCLYNKDLLEDVHTGTDMYQIVDDGEWTLDKLIELSHGAYQDTNANGQVDYGDRFGFQSIDLHFDCFYNGSGLKNIDIGTDGTLSLSDDFTSAKAQDLAEKLCNFLFVSGDAFGEGTTNKYGSIDAFAIGQAMFVVDRSYSTSFNAMKSTDVNYGILPVPKYDTNQESYITCMAFPYTMYSISYVCTQGDAAAATIEDMAYNSYTTVTPAIFEITMKAKYSKEVDDARMFDIIREGVYFDCGRIFTTSLSNLSYSVFRDCIKSNAGASWSVTASKNKKLFNNSINKINKAMGELE